MQQYLYGERSRTIFSFTTCPDLSGGEKLFSGNLHSIMTWLIQELRKSNKLIKSSNQLRSSVIVNWLKQHNLRQVQYLAGHRHISSTERYKQEDLQDLQAALNLFHPMK